MSKVVERKNFTTFPRGPWAGLPATYIAELCDVHPRTMRRYLKSLHDRLGRYPTRRELGIFIWHIEELNRERTKDFTEFVYF